MPAASTAARATGSAWQRELARAISSLAELAAALDLSVAELAGGSAAAADFPLRVPRGFVARMARGDRRDPLLMQVLPLAREGVATAGYGADPLQEVGLMQHPGLLQKYQGRALLVATGACAVNCRYCFRRAFPYAEASVSPPDLMGVLARVSNDPCVEEVILSGGDPLTLSDQRLDTLLAAIGRIGHVRRIRIHSRVPVVLPERVDAGLLAVLGRAPRPLVLVVHANHANELDATVEAATRQLATVCATLLNQSVLLRGVNDDPGALVRLSTRLFEIGVLPYYLHQLDKVQGAAHFRVGERRARRLAGALAAQLPGYLVPRLVHERPGAPAKELLLPDLVSARQGVRRR